MDTSINRIKARGNNQLTKKQIHFILNFRETPFSTTLSIGNLGQKLGDGIWEREEALLKEYISPSERTMQQLRHDGWFNRTYSTVKEIAVLYAALNHSIHVVYTPEHGVDGQEIKIARILYFYKLKGIVVPLNTIKLTHDQLRLKNQRVGVTAMNCAPGAGKTEAQAHKAVELMDEGVIFVVYTGDAAINAKARVGTLTNDISEISSTRGKKMWICTIHSFANAINPRGQSNVDFDEMIESAIRNIDQFGNIFLKGDNTRAYSHLILDEGQDNSGALYRFLAKVYSYWQFESFTVVGDLDQRLDHKKGGVFAQLMKQGSGIVPEERPTFDKPYIIDYNDTFRFANPILLQHAIKMSAYVNGTGRKFTHVGPIAEPEKIKVYKDFKNLAGDIINKIKILGIAPGHIAIISPIINTDHRNRVTVNDICEVLISNEIGSGTDIRPDMVYKGSIHSVKGLQFKYVYFIGASRFPDYMNLRYEDIQDGKCLNFVANTRASHGLAYLTDAQGSLPAGVDASLVEGGSEHQVQYRKETFLNAFKSYDISAENYRKFSEYNMLTTPYKKVCTFPFVVKDGLIPIRMIDLQYELISAVVRYFDGLTIPMQLTSFRRMQNRMYNEYARTCEIYDMMDLKRIIQVSDAQHAMLIDLRTEYPHTDIDTHKIFKECMTGRKSSLTSMEHINNVIMSIVAVISKNIPINDFNEAVKQTVFTKYLRVSAITTPTTIVLFTESLYFGSYIKHINRAHRVFVARLETGDILEMEMNEGLVRLSRPVSTAINHSCPRAGEDGFGVSDEHSSYLVMYDYMLRALYSIAMQLRLIRGRGNYSVANANQDEPMYFIDTEFKSRVWRKAGTIYDIALINGCDSFATTCSLIKAERDYYSPQTFTTPGSRQLTNPTPVIPYEHLCMCPTIGEFRSFFVYMLHGRMPTFYYYAASHDIAPFYEADKIYDTARKADDPSKEDWAYRHGFEYKYKFRNAKFQLGKGKLSEVYDAITNSKSEMYRHIFLHTAVPDALLLMEYAMTYLANASTEEIPTAIDEE